MAQPAADDSTTEWSVGPGTARGRRRTEATRKLIHLASVSIPVLVWFSPRPLAVALLGIILVVALLIEWARMQIRWARYHFLIRTRPLLRRRERYRLSGATYMALGYFLAVLILPQAVAVVAMLYLAVGDAIAALVGKRWGRHRTAAGKSWEGAFAAFVANCAIGILVPGIPLLAAVGGAAGAALLEITPLPFDDNLTVALGGGGVLYLMVAVFG